MCDSNRKAPARGAKGLCVFVECIYGLSLKMDDVMFFFPFVKNLVHDPVCVPSRCFQTLISFHAFEKSDFPLELIILPISFICLLLLMVNGRKRESGPLQMCRARTCTWGQVLVLGSWLCCPIQLKVKPRAEFWPVISRNKNQHPS